MRKILFPLLASSLICSNAQEIEQVPHTAAPSPQQAAPSGDAEELLARGCFYAREGDKRQAEDYLRRAAELEHPQAGAVYGVWSFAEHRYAPALLYLTPEAARGNADAAFCLGYMHYKGWGVPHTPAEAYRLFEQAAQKGHTQAVAMLALMHLIGEAAHADADVAAQLLSIICDSEEDRQDDTEAADDEDTADHSQTLIADILALSELRIPQPNYILGLMQLRGVGMPEAPATALPRLVQAADSAETSDTTELLIATLFRRGLGIDADPAIADERETRVSAESKEQLTPLVEAYLSADTPEEKREALVALLPRTPEIATPEQRQLIETIMQMPPYAIHEADRTEFRMQLESGSFRTENGTHYLSIGGDGTVGDRIFILTPANELYIFSEDWENGGYDTQRYDATKGEMQPLFSLPKELLSE